MNGPSTITIELLSETTFSSGRGTKGQVDIDIEHTPEGLPTVSGKTVRGFLRGAWLTMSGRFPELDEPARRVLGRGKSLEEDCILRVGDANVDSDVRDWVRAALHRENQPLSVQQVLSAITDIRYQTSLNRTTGASQRGSLRSSRVVIRNIRLEAPLAWLEPPSSADIRLLAMTVLAVRQAGLSSSRGRGHVRLTLDGSLGMTYRAAGLEEE